MKTHSSSFLNLVNKAKSRIQEITPSMLKEKLDQNDQLCLIDVREDHEWEDDHIPSAIHLSKGIIERDIEKQIPDLLASIVVYCSGGFRCALVADNLQAMGYQNVYSLSTGLTGWREAGYPIENKKISVTV
jgi:rhodanese-related sulfurtransferase